MPRCEWVDSFPGIPGVDDLPGDGWIEQECDAPATHHFKTISLEVTWHGVTRAGRFVEVPVKVKLCKGHARHAAGEGETVYRFRRDPS